MKLCLAFDVATPGPNLTHLWSLRGSGAMSGRLCSERGGNRNKKDYSQVTQVTQWPEFRDLPCPGPGTVFGEWICHFCFPLSTNSPQVTLEMEQLWLWQLQFASHFMLHHFSVVVPGLLWHGLVSTHSEIQEWPLFITCRWASTQVSNFLFSLRCGLKMYEQDFLGGAVVKNLPANAGDVGSSPGPGRSHMPRSN